MKIILRDDFGGEHDVTEHVRSLYGHVTGSMDWGSGFLDTDEMLEVQEFGYLSGFEDEDLDKTITQYEQSLQNSREKAEMDARRYVGDVNEGYWAKRVKEGEAWVVGLQRIRDARARLFQQTDDVTDFDA